MRIERARREDVAAILDISNWAAANTDANFATEPEQLGSWLSSWELSQRMHPWLVARGDDGRPGTGIDGFAKSSSHRARGAYAWTAEVSVYVHPDRHKRGVGTALYRRLIPMLAKQGYVMLLAGITSPNPASERLHESFGFVRCGTFHRAGWKHGRWADVGYWELDLRPGDHAPGPILSVDEVWSDDR